MTETKRKYLVRRIVASAIVAVLLGVGLARAFIGGSPPPPPDNAAAMVPADALIYLNLGTSKGAAQWKHTADAMSKLPLAGQLRDALFAATTSSTLGRLTLERDVRPWLGNEAAYAELPGSGQKLLLFRARDEKAALRAISRAAGSSPPQPYRGTLLRDVGGGSVAGVSGGWALVGAPGAVHSALDLRSKPAASLAKNSTYSDLVGGLPSDRVGNAWLSQPWLNAHLAGPSAILAGLARVPSFQSAAVGFGDNGKLMRLAFRARATAGPAAGSGCSGTTGKGDTLLSKAPARPALFLGMAGAGCVLQDLMASPSSAIGTALQSFATQAQREGVNLQRDLLPLLGGDSGLSITPGPTLTLDAGDVPAQQSLNVLGRLQPVLIKLLNPEASGVAPTFGAQTVNGVTAMTASLTPGLQLSYAAFDGDLVLSTALSGIADAKKGAHLDQSKDFKAVLGDRPKDASALVFLDLEKLLALADQAGLGSNPTYAAVRDDLQKIGAAGGVLSREGNDIDAELRLKNP
ncbi:MAG TPA: DUF3352 domain-containing protein [Thermoleophilaceae bacterium]